MKKYFLLIISILILTTGCSNIQNLSYDDIINNSIHHQLKTTNKYRSGYTYYLPKGLRIIKNEGNNEIFAKDEIYYYLYVDTVSYFNKVREDYNQKQDVVFSKKLENDDLFGYTEIKKTSNGKYFIEIMYNYAKIEVIVPEEHVKESLAYSLLILTSIQYQDTVLKSLMDENTLSANEVEYNIFETANTESGYLQIAEEYGQYQEEEKKVDPDFITR